MKRSRALEVLGFAPSRGAGPPEEAIRRAYRKLALQVHARTGGARARKTTTVLMLPGCGRDLAPQYPSTSCVRVCICVCVFCICICICLWAVTPRHVSMALHVRHSSLRSIHALGSLRGAMSLSFLLSCVLE